MTRAAEIEKAVELVVVSSNLYVPGVARVHADVPERIDVEDGSFVEVRSASGEAVVTKLQTDCLLYENEIALSHRDIERLNVREGDLVRVCYRRRTGWLQRLKI